MAKFPRFTAETPPPGGAGLVRAQDISALTQTGDAAFWGSIGQLGAGMKDLARTGFVIDQDKRELDRHLQYSNYTQDAKMFVQSQQESLDETNIESIEQANDISRNSLKDFQSFLNKKIGTIKDPELRTRMEVYKNNALPEHWKYFRDKTTEKWKDYYLDTVKEHINSYVAAGQLDEAEAEIKKIEGKLITHQQAGRWREDVEQQKILVSINQAGATLMEEDIEKASKMIDQSKIFATEADKQFYRNQLKSVINNKRALLKEQAEADREEANKQIMDYVVKGSLTVEEVEKRRDILSASDYKSAMKAALNNFAESDDAAVANEIDRVIIDLHNGIGTESDVMNILLDNKKNLTKETFTRLQNSIPREHEEYINKIILENRHFIDTQILVRDITGRLWGNAEQEKRAMRARIDYDSMVKKARTEEKELTPDILLDFAQIAITLNSADATKKRDIINKLENIKETIEKVRTIDVEAAYQKAIEKKELPHPKTKEEYDILSSGTEYIHPDGSKRIKK